MKIQGSIIIILGISGILGAMMPLAEVNNYAFYANISHLGSMLKLLYLLPLGIIIIGILQINDQITKTKAWLVTLGIIGLLLSALASLTALMHVEAFTTSFGRHESTEELSIGLGSYILLVSYGALIIFPWIKTGTPASQPLTNPPNG